VNTRTPGHAAVRGALDDLDKIETDVIAVYDKGFSERAHERVLTMGPSDL
jgi:hypothetical protein